MPLAARCPTLLCWLRSRAHFALCCVILLDAQKQDLRLGSSEDGAGVLVFDRVSTEAQLALPNLRRLYGIVWLPGQINSCFAGKCSFVRSLPCRSASSPLSNCFARP